MLACCCQRRLRRTAIIHRPKGPCTHKAHPPTWWKVESTRSQYERLIVVRADGMQMSNCSRKGPLPSPPPPLPRGTKSVEKGTRTKTYPPEGLLLHNLTGLPDVIWIRFGLVEFNIFDHSLKPVVGWDWFWFNVIIMLLPSCCVLPQLELYCGRALCAQL